MTLSVVRGTREQIHLPGGHSFRVLRWTRSLSEVEVLHAPGAVARMTGEGEHWHYHMEMELTLFITGKGTRFVGDDIAPFAPGDLVLLGEKLPHYWHAHGVSSGLSVQWTFSKSHPFWAFPENLPLQSLFTNAARGLHFTGTTAAALTARLHDLTRTGGTDQLGLLLRIFAQMGGASERDCRPLSTNVFSLPAASNHQQAMAEVVRHLVSGFREPIRLEELLEITSMSKPTFSRLFKKHSGKSFSDFVTHLRLQAACRELVDTDRPIIDVAFGCGFHQISFFNRIFRRIFQCTPTQYRSRKRQPMK